MAFHTVVIEVPDVISAAAVERAVTVVLERAPLGNWIDGPEGWSPRVVEYHHEKMTEGPDLVIWRTEYQPDDAEGGATADDCWEVVDPSGEGSTLLVGSLKRCRAEYPGAAVVSEGGR